MTRLSDTFSIPAPYRPYQESDSISVLDFLNRPDRNQVDSLTIRDADSAAQRILRTRGVARRLDLTTGNASTISRTARHKILLDQENDAYIEDLAIGNGDFVVRNCVVKKATVALDSKAEFENCRIESLEISRAARATVSIRDCMIGNLTIRNASLLELQLRRCRLFRVSCENQNPFSGKVVIANSRFTRNHRHLGEAQQYRNIRKFLLDLGNTVAAGVFLAPELILERPFEPIINRVFSWLYQAISDFGNSIARPLLWWAGSGLLFAYIYWLQGGPSPVTIDGDVLLNLDTEHQFVRSAVLSLASMVDPLGFAGLSDLVEETSLAMIGTHVAHRLISIILAALTLLAIRRRFKIS